MFHTKIFAKVAKNKVTTKKKNYVYDFFFISLFNPNKMTNFAPLLQTHLCRTTFSCDGELRHKTQKLNLE